MHRFIFNRLKLAAGRAKLFLARRRVGNRESTNATYVKATSRMSRPLASVDVVISNGVSIWRCKSKVFGAVARVLKPGGRFAISDIVTEVRAARNYRVQPDATGRLHWLSRPAGPLSRPDRSGRMKVVKVEDNPTYQFSSDNERGATRIRRKEHLLLAVKP